MNIARIALAACVCVLSGAAVAQAQPGADYNGAWVASFTNARGVPRSGSVTIDGATGTWDMDTQARGNPCAGLKAPIAVTRADADGLVFDVRRSQALAGCSDSTISLKKTDGGGLEGSFEGRPLTLRRP